MIMNAFKFYIASIVMLICISSISIAETIDNNSIGFRKLKWGSSFQDAISIYSDLVFEKAESVRNDNGYYRTNEDYLLSNVNPDKLYYYFKNNRFYRLRAYKHVTYKKGNKWHLFPMWEGTYMELSDDISYKYGYPQNNDRTGTMSNYWKNGDVEIYLFLSQDNDIKHIELEIINIKERSKALGF